MYSGIVTFLFLIQPYLIETSHWKKGPVPQDTYGAGYIVLADGEFAGKQVFAKFEGDHVITLWGAKEVSMPLDSASFYNDSLKHMTERERSVLDREGD